MNDPELFGLTCKKLKTRLAWFVQQGLTTTMIGERPQVLRRNVISAVNQAKVRFLTQVMKKEVREVLTCTPFFNLSLCNYIGPRWAFHSKYCKDQPFRLSTRLSNGKPRFLKQLPSLILDAECISLGMTRFELFEEFATGWKEGEGKEWNVERKKKETIVKMGVQHHEGGEGL